ncbi:hypothetical protein [Lysinibacillus contaminans]|uniref:hypothetical protein n=1 Tax=Lysinibacillus contaminans TaxID=1293441 RepID=UPI001B80D3D1|nr:hypothetical protein [Lysinibacillus contaminans]
MTKTKWGLTLLGAMDLILIVMHFADYFILFLKPSGYLIPLGINIVVLSVIGLRSGFPKILIIISVFVSMPIILFYVFMILLLDNNYTKIDSPYNRQSLVIEYRHATLGETTYFYNFYKTMFGFVGKRLDDQSITMMIPARDHPFGIDAEGALGLGNENWITANAVRFFTWQGMKDVYLNSSQSSFDQDNTKKVIEEFIKMDKNKEDGQTIKVNGNLLTIRYDRLSNQNWIEVTNKNDKGAIPRQQCSRIMPNKEQGFYVLEECTHQWEYPLYPMTE